MSGSSMLIAGALALFWSGAVFAISFLEAPLKFRAPGVTVSLGLGIGRIVFRALNLVEVVLAVGVLSAVLVGGLSGGWADGPIVLIVALAVLVIQFALIRPRLNRHSDAVFAGGQTKSRSKIHWVYVGFEAVKLVLIVVGGVLTLATLS